MKKKPIKTILGATIILAAITNSHSATLPTHAKRIKNLILSSRIKDKTSDQTSISDGSKTESTGT